LKKLANIFTEVSQVTSTDSYGATVLPTFGTQSEFDSYSAEDMDILEQSNIDHMQRFSKIRCQEFLTKMLNKRVRNSVMGVGVGGGSGAGGGSSMSDSQRSDSMRSLDSSLSFASSVGVDSSRRDDVNVVR